MNFYLSNGCLVIARLWEFIRRYACDQRDVWMKRADQVLGPQFAELDVTGVDSLPDIIEHAPRCGALNPAYFCDCGSFKGYDRLSDAFMNHRDGCPCHCTCGFWDRLRERLQHE